MDFSGKQVLVTGAARRAGAEIVRAFAARGARLIVHANAHFDEAEKLVSRLPGEGHRALRADLAAERETAALFAAAGRIDILVNNASFYRFFPENDEKERARFERVNFAAPLELMNFFVRQELREGAVVNILDQAIFSDRNDPYTASRRKLGEATLDFAAKYGVENLRFNAVAPGPMLPPEELPQSKMENVVRRVALLRAVTTADFAQAVLFLAGCDSVTGAILPVDGGQHLVDTQP
ncbi:MAG: SDR family oxidoreductase [Victivallaceae bacterium]|nr:SDR family oxidoreductase [Victivallaceae bacterium]